METTTIKKTVKQTTSPWEGFNEGRWQHEVNTLDFIKRNYTEYKGDDSFLEGAAPSTDKLWDKLQELFEVQHQKNGVVLRIVLVIYPKVYLIQMFLRRSLLMNQDI